MANITYLPVHPDTMQDFYSTLVYKYDEAAEKLKEAQDQNETLKAEVKRLNDRVKDLKKLLEQATSDDVEDQNDDF